MTDECNHDGGVLCTDDGNGQTVCTCSICGAVVEVKASPGFVLSEWYDWYIP